MAKNYQSKSETLKNAKSDAKTMSTVYPGKEYWIIESVDNANTKKFFVEEGSGFTRTWETNHGHYKNGKFIKPE
jgi:hypothetical protein